MLWHTSLRSLMILYYFHEQVPHHYESTVLLKNMSEYLTFFSYGQEEDCWQAPGQAMHLPLVTIKLYATSDNTEYKDQITEEAT